jgi:hypothetical protein
LASASLQDIVANWIGLSITRGNKDWNKPTDHLSNASGNKVWFV